MDKLRELTELVQRLGGGSGVVTDENNEARRRDVLSDLPRTKAFLDQLPRKRIEQTAKENEAKAAEALRLLERVDELVESHTSTAASLTTFLAQLSTIPESLAQANSLAQSIHNQLINLSTLISSEESLREQHSLSTLQHEQDILFAQYAREKRVALEKKKEEFARQLDAFRRERMGLVGEKFVGGKEDGGLMGLQGGGGSGAPGKGKKKKAGGSGGGGGVAAGERKIHSALSSSFPSPPSSLPPSSLLSQSLPGPMDVKTFGGTPPVTSPSSTGTPMGSRNNKNYPPPPATTNLSLEHVFLTEEEHSNSFISGLNEFLDADDDDIVDGGGDNDTVDDNEVESGFLPSSSSLVSASTTATTTPVSHRSIRTPGRTLGIASASASATATATATETSSSSSLLLLDRDRNTTTLTSTTASSPSTLLSLSNSDSIPSYDRDTNRKLNNPQPSKHPFPPPPTTKSKSAGIIAADEDFDEEMASLLASSSTVTTIGSGSSGKLARKGGKKKKKV